MGARMLSNAEVAERLTAIADLLELLGERFKPEAYRRAARSIEGLPEALEAFAARGELRAIPGVGEAIADKIEELLRTGALGYLDRLRAQVPAGVLELMRLAGVGPKTARRFWVELGIAGPPELAAAIDAGRLAGVKGFADRKIALLRAAADTARAPPTSARRPLEAAWPVAQALLAGLRSSGAVEELAVAGSFRRGRETVGDLDLLATSEAPERVFEAFSRLPPVREVRLRGPTKETVILDGGLQVDLRVVAPEAFGAALQYFTGSKDHNVRLRSRAREQGLKVNEYGVYRADERIAGRTEEEVYRALGLAFIPPELREDHGEIDAAAAGPLPRLVDATDLLGDLHVHLSERPTEAELGRRLDAARHRGLRWLGVVVAVAEDGALRETVPPEVRERLPSGGAVTCVPALEVRGPLAPLPASAAGLGLRYAIAAPRSAADLRGRPPMPVALLGHAGGAAERSRPFLEAARSWKAAVELGPGPERFDSSVGRVAREAGVPLAVPTGVGAGEDESVPAVALAFARRAGALPADVRNTAPEAPGGPRDPTGPAPARRPVRRRR